MYIRPLPAEERAVRRYIEELWLPYHRDLESAVERHALADDVDVVAEELEFRLDRLEDESYLAWVAIDGTEPADAVDIATVDADLAGFITTDIDESPSVFDRPDRLGVGDFYVRESYRGTGLARDLMDRAVKRARATGCGELVLDVDVDNERAIGFYRKVGFEPYRFRMALDADES